MAVYRRTNREFEPLAETSFEVENLYERYDLQRMLRDRPDLLEEGLFVIAEEYGDWEESNRRIDLLALDGQGRLVIVASRGTQAYNPTRKVTGKEASATHSDTGGPKAVQRTGPTRRI